MLTKIVKNLLTNLRLKINITFHEKLKDMKKIRR